MAFSYSDATSSDVVLTWLNGFKNKVAAFLNAIPGASLVAASVTNDKLAKKKARFEVSMLPGALCLVDNGSVLSYIGSRTMLNSDGSAATYTCVGWSFSVNKGPCIESDGTTVNAGSALGSGAVAAIKVYKQTPPAARTLWLTIDISSTTALALGTPLSADLSASPLTVSAGDILTVDYLWTSGASAAYPNPQLCLDFTLAHAGT